MELLPHEQGRLDAYLATFTQLAGDRRTAALLGETIRGIPSCLRTGSGQREPPL